MSVPNYHELHNLGGYQLLHRDTASQSLVCESHVPPSSSLLETLGDDAVAIVIVQGTYVYPQQYVTLGEGAAGGGSSCSASYLTTPLAEYPVPVLHLSGTLDGQTRPTRIAKTFAELQTMTETEPDAPIRRPVVLLEAVDHAHFFTGELPVSVAENDILSELDGDEARRQLAQQSVAFMEVARAGPAADQAADILRESFNSTGQFLAPLFDLQQLEADGDSSEWARFAQTFLLNIAWRLGGP
ncbi:hypothetical protein FJT64_027812 [Amphibalanus amphitrite]|uniref:Uncharacterized protein n=1 Tax=Amphibalanus amphitrite TaxID=1232801 RepID=A0A6A4WBM1_AMPAM|nr:hypothetical protein FJT64_027812 [Amphibalanus amphitrite]